MERKEVCGMRSNILFFLLVFLLDVYKRQGSYTYLDVNGDRESGTTFRWLRGEDVYKRQVPTGLPAVLPLLMPAGGDLWDF